MYHPTFNATSPSGILCLSALQGSKARLGLLPMNSSCVRIRTSQMSGKHVQTLESKTATMPTVSTPFSNCWEKKRMNRHISLRKIRMKGKKCVCEALKKYTVIKLETINRKKAVFRRFKS